MSKAVKPQYVDGSNGSGKPRAPRYRTAVGPDGKLVRKRAKRSPWIFENSEAEPALVAWSSDGARIFDKNAIPPEILLPMQFPGLKP